MRPGGNASISTVLALPKSMRSIIALRQQSFLNAIDATTKAREIQVERNCVVVVLSLVPSENYRLPRGRWTARRLPDADFPLDWIFSKSLDALDALVIQVT
jgi:hypothetical protein